MIEEVFKVPIYKQKLKLDLKTIETFCTDLSLKEVPFCITSTNYDNKIANYGK